jgi:hypothetical protein
MRFRGSAILAEDLDDPYAEGRDVLSLDRQPLRR